MTAPRRCAVCAADISHRRADAKTCEGSRCRKRKSRGQIDPPPRIVDIKRALEDEIDERAHQRHLAWITRDLTLITELEADLDRLYELLRRKRAGWPLTEYAGRSASVVMLAERPLRRPWRVSDVVTKAVAA